MLPRNDRRRRVLADELLNSAGSEVDASAKKVPAGDSQRYAPAAHRDGQPRLCDMVPRRPLSLLLALGVPLGVIAGVLTITQLIDDFAQHVPRAALAAFEPGATHGVVTWLASGFLLVNVYAALLVYSLRRHRVDDYYGRYRIWLAVAGASLLASLDVSTGISRLLAALLGPLAQRCRLPAEYGLPAVLTVVGSYLAVRLCMEVYRSRLAMTAVVLAIVCLIAVATNVAAWRGLLPAEHEVLVRSALKLCGCLLLPATTLLFARHVLLDIEGKVPQPAAKPRKKSKVKTPAKSTSRTTDLPSTAEAKTASAATRVDQAQKPKPTFTSRSDLNAPSQSTSIKPASISRPTTANAASSHDDDDEEEDHRDLSQMSRAERKRLKREAKLARRAEAA